MERSRLDRGQGAPPPDTPEETRISPLRSEILNLTLEQVKAKWPDLVVDRSELEPHLVHLRERRGREPAHAHLADVALACACASGNAVAIRLLEGRLRERVPVYLARIRGGPTLAGDVTQELLLKLLVNDAKIKEYAGDGPLDAWLRIAAVRTALNLLRVPANAPADAHEVGAEVAALNPELDLVRARHAADFEQAVTRAFAALAPRERTLLRLRFADSLDLEAIATLHHTHRSTIVRWLAAARAKLADEARKHLRTTANLTPSEIRSLITLLRSQLDVTLRSIRA